MATIKCEYCGNYIDDFMKDDCPVCKSKGKKKHASKKTSLKELKEFSYVNVVDFDMSFSNMVVFMIKWAIASIPAMIIIFAIYMLLASMFGVGVVSLFG